MSAEIVEHVEAGDAGEAAAAVPKNSKRKLVIIVAAAALLLLGGAAGFMLMSRGGSSAGHNETAKNEAGAHGAAPAFIDVPAIVVNLRSSDGTPRFLKIHFVLVPGAKGTSEEFTAKLPLLLDAYQPFLRELRPEDLAGSAAVFRIKEELLRRAADALGKEVIGDVLIQDLIQQ